MSKYVLLTRPRKDSEALAAQVEALGYTPFIEPMLEIVPQAARLPDFNDYGGFVFTSANAVSTLPKSVFDQLPQLNKPVYALAARTGQVLPWFAQYAITAEGGATELSARIMQDVQTGDLAQDKPLLHVCGEDVRNPIEVAGLTIEQFSVYKAEAAVKMSAECCEIIKNGEVDSVTLFSTRTAETFVSLAQKYGLEDSFLTTKALCLADSMVKSVRVLKWRDVQVAHTPDKESVLALLK